MQQIWINEKTGDINAGDQQPGERAATPEETERILGLAPTLDEARIAKLLEINNGYESVMDYIQAGYPDSEILSWERQATQANELIINPNANALFVRTLATTKGIELEEMCRRIFANASSWEPIAAMLTAQRQLMEEAVLGADTVEEIVDIKVGYLV